MAYESGYSDSISMPGIHKMGTGKGERMLALYVEGKETINEKVEYFSDISSYIITKKDLEVYLRKSYEEYHHRTRKCIDKVDFRKLYEQNLRLIQSLDKNILQLHYSPSKRNQNNGTQVYLNLVSSEDLEVFKQYLWPILIPNQQSPRVVYTKFILTKIRIYNSNYIYMKPEFKKEYSKSELVEVLNRYLSDESKPKDVTLHKFILRMCNFIEDEDELTQICEQLGLSEFNEDAKRCLYICKELINEKVDLDLSELEFPHISPKNFNKGAPCQQIFYGAPGTGKSFKIDKDTKGHAVVRTTFHPDSDYSTFVGAYKPIMEEDDVKVTPVVVNNGISLQPSGTYKERRIVYKFVKQAFLKAYLGAWKKYAEHIIMQVSVDAGNGEKWFLKSVDDTRVDAHKESLMDKQKFEEKVKDFWSKQGDEVGTQDHWCATACKWYKEKISNVQNPTADECWNAIEQALNSGETISGTPVKSQTYHIKKGENGFIVINNDNQGAAKDAIEQIYNNISESNNSISIQASIARKLKEFSDDFEEAWNELKKKVNEKITAPQFLIIEEINRGNCAQIFGDLFQLLDRSDNRFSTYPIEADSDIKDEVARAFREDEEYKLNTDISIEGAVKGYTSNYGKTLSQDVQEGRVLLLPPNLHIWATMNTSDQSLFPIDSAFKRRWDWEYMPIGYKNANWEIEIGTKKYKWVDFQRIINDMIYSVDNSEDKQLGDYFVNANLTGNKISSEVLLNKILFYLWNDVCKDDPEQIFRWKDDKENDQEKSIKFSGFFCEKNERDRRLQGFMAFLGIKANGNAEGKKEKNDDTTAGNEDVVNT